MFRYQICKKERLKSQYHVESPVYLFIIRGASLWRWINLDACLGIYFERLIHKSPVKILSAIVIKVAIGSSNTMPCGVKIHHWTQRKLG